MSITGTLSTAGGLLLIAYLARDVVLTLFHPESHGALARGIQRGVWAVAVRVARRRRAALVAAGPSMILLVPTTWLALAALGWALIYWPALPDGFVLTPGLDPGEQADFTDALYHSLVALTTLGYGDLAPATTWLRIAAPMQALVGFGLLTATISWVLSIYPALTRIRGLAGDVATLEETRGRPGAPSADDLGSAARRDLLGELEGRVVEVHADLSQFPVAYFFESSDPRSSLASALPALFDEADRARAATDPDVRFAAERLRIALERLAEVIGRDLQNRPDDPPARVVARLQQERAPAYRERPQPTRRA